MPVTQNIKLKYELIDAVCWNVDEIVFMFISLLFHCCYLTIIFADTLYCTALLDLDLELSNQLHWIDELDCKNESLLGSIHMQDCCKIMSFQ